MTAIPPFHWTEPTGDGHNRRAFFRREFTLPAVPESAFLNVFADTHYHLRVNGVFVAYGPLRFYPEHPQYDRHDLSPWLRPGSNVVSLVVLHAGVATFHALVVQAGVVAWGAVALPGGGEIPLDMGADWLCREAAGYDRSAPKFSFTSLPIQILDERLAITGWDLPGASLEGWSRPVPLARQDAWGPLSPRELPALQYEEVLPQRLLSAHRHVSEDRHLSFRVADFSESQRLRHVYARSLIFACTYIHSPQAQSVPVGIYWGEHYLNGELLDKSDDRRGRPACSTAYLKLKKGWNFFFISYGMWTHTWDFNMAVPHEAGLEFSASKQHAIGPAFLVSQVFPRDSAVAEEIRPADLVEPPALPGGWTEAHLTDVPVLPAKHLAWIGFGPDLGIPGHQVGAFSVPTGRDTSFVFDMGGFVLGRIVVEFEASPGTVLDVGYGEDLDTARQRPNYFNNVQVHSAERLIAAGGKSTFETFVPRGFRYLQVAFSQVSGPVRVDRVQVVSQLYPHRREGYFRCGDPLFNSIWESGWRTLLLCSEDVYTDCPGRERTLYAGDMLAEFATAAVTSGDTALVRRCIRIFLQSHSEETRWQQSHAPMERSRGALYDYPLLTLLTAEWYVRLTGDAALAKEAYAQFSALMERCLEQRQESGLYASFRPPFIDHVGVRRDGVSCPLNALISRSWRAMAALARFLGRTEEAERHESWARDCADAVRAQFWDPSSQSFADCLIEGRLSEEHSPAANYWCVFHEVASAEQRESILRHYRAQWTHLDGNPEHFGCPYGCFYFLSSLLLHEQTDEAASMAEEFMRRQWGIMYFSGADTIWEHFLPDRSRCHAWSTIPNYYLSTRVLGVRLGFPEQADLDQVEIRPVSSTLNWAEGAVPHPKGRVEVRWRVQGSALLCEVEVPEGVSFKVAPEVPDTYPMLPDTGVVVAMHWQQGTEDLAQILIPDTWLKNLLPPQ